MIITIARQCGSGGHEIGKELASRLGLELYDRKKLEEEAKKLGKLDENKEFFQEKAVNQPALQHCCKLRRKQSDGKIF